MGTEVAISFSALRTQLETEKSSLSKLDENIKKIVQSTGRYNDRFNNTSGEFARGGQRLGGRNAYPEQANNFKNDDLFGKRKHETKTVFSRLSGRGQDSDGEGGATAKRARVSSAVSRELPSRADVLRAQDGDETARTRNRRIFGALLGTLHKFKQEEIGLQTKEDKKAQVEKKIEEQARLEKEREQKERKTLFAERESKKANIKALEAKMARVHEFELWETSQRSLNNFILTKTKPHLYWLPKKMSEKATEKLNLSKKFNERLLTKKRQEIQEELQRIEQRCLRWGQAKENHPQPEHDPDHPHHDHDHDDDRSKKRDKFAMDVDEKDKEDSDADDHNGNQEQQDEARETEESKMETTIDPETQGDMTQDTDLPMDTLATPNTEDSEAQP